MTFPKVCLSLIISIAAVSQTVNAAAVLWDNGAPDYANAFRSDFASNNPPGSTDTGQVGDDFTLASLSQLTGLNWWGAYVLFNPDSSFSSTPNTVDNFTIRLFNYVGPNPSSVPFFQLNVGNAVNRTDTGNNIGGAEVFAYSVALPAIPLTSETYLLSVVNDSTGQTNDWFWATSNDAMGNAVGRTMDGDPWMPAGVEGDFQGFETAFNIEGTAIPEASTWVIGALAVTLLVFQVARARAFSKGKAVRAKS